MNAKKIFPLFITTTTTTILVVIITVIYNCEMAEGINLGTRKPRPPSRPTYTVGEGSSSDVFFVGDSNGWSGNVINWPKGKTFHAGDILMFYYNLNQYNVYKTDWNGYNNCKTNAGETPWSTRHDRITLTNGWNYFINTGPGACADGTKIAVYAN